MSDWSHKHVAYIAGLGSFGRHHMLITDKGCCGRIGSVVTDAAIPATPRSDRERCLFKADGSCGKCLERCPILALKDGRLRPPRLLRPPDGKRRHVRTLRLGRYLRQMRRHCALLFLRSGEAGGRVKTTGQQQPPENEAALDVHSTSIAPRRFAPPAKLIDHPRVKINPLTLTVVVIF